MSHRGIPRTRQQTLYLQDTHGKPGRKSDEFELLMPGRCLCTYQCCLYLILFCAMVVMTFSCRLANIVQLHRSQRLPPPFTATTRIARRIAMPIVGRGTVV